MPCSCQLIQSRVSESLAHDLSALQGRPRERGLDPTARSSLKMKLVFASVLLVAAVQAASLGQEQCSWGPSDWCRSIQTATSCQAFSHCLHRVWKPQPLKVQQTKACSYSQKLVRTIRGALAINQQHGEATHLITSMCSFVRESAMRKECKVLVTNYLPQIFKLMESGMEPASVAAVMGLCTPYDDSANQTPVAKKGPHNKEVAEGDLNKALKEKQDIGESAECIICHLVMEGLDQILSSNRSEAAIQQALDSICQKLPEGIKPQCLSFVNEYTPVVIKLLVQELNPQQVCLALKLCQSASDKATDTEKERGADSIVCELCELVVTNVDQLLGENKSEAAIQQALDDICQELPAGIKPQCLSFVNKYAPVVIQLLIQELNPQQVCLALKLCQSASGSVPLVFSKADNVADPLECELCEAIITQINQFIGDNRTEQTFFHVVEKLCDLLKGDLVLQCKSVVEIYGPAVLNFLQHVDNPTQVCTDLHLCPANRLPVNTAQHVKQMLVGTEECTYGPSFWCATMENARKCGMEKDCVEKYGLKP